MCVVSLYVFLPQRSYFHNKALTKKWYIDYAIEQKDFAIAVLLIEAGGEDVIKLNLTTTNPGTLNGLVKFLNKTKNSAFIEISTYYNFCQMSTNLEINIFKSCSEESR